jgi:iron complex outermembrane receptor protein
MKKIVKVSGLLLLGLSMVLPYSLCAQQQAVDTTEVHQTIQEIIVSGKRPERFSPGSRIVSIDTSALQWYSNNSLSELLSFSLPVYLKSYGPGMLSSIAFRGTSPSHTAVLWNGFNINQPSNGQTDFAIVPLVAHDAIEIQYGNASTNYGSGAIGGTVLLSSALQFGQGYRVALKQSLGSFHTFDTHLHTSYSTNKLSLQTKLFRQQSRNDFSFKNITRFDNRLEKQSNAAVEQYGFTQDMALAINSKNVLTLRGWYNYNNRQIAPAMGSAHRDARQKDENFRVTAEWNHFSNAGNTSVRMAFFDEHLLYTEEQLNSETSIQTLQTQAEHEYTLKDKLILKGGVELQQFHARADGYGGYKKENRGSVFLLTRYQPNDRLDLSVNIRQAMVEGYNPPFTPSAGLSYKLINQPHHTLSLKTNTAKSYRIPTLNERFWLTGSNPDIKPENSWSYESGLAHLWKNQKMSVSSEITTFYMKVDNWIQWQPTSQGFWSPVNVMQVNPKGLEFSSDITIQNRYISTKLGTAYTYTASTISQSYTNNSQERGKQLMYVPLHSWVAYGNIEINAMTLGANLSYTGYRYTSNSNTDWLSSYALLNLIAAKSINWNRTNFQVSGRVNNILNKSYQNTEYRPMPGRNFQVSLQITYSKTQTQ